MIFHDTQLKVIHWIHEFRTPALDQFFKALDFFDQPEFFMILIPIVWLIRGWKPGYRLYAILLLSSIFNQLLKAYFLSPRPYVLDPTLTIIPASGLGFPSGAAQTASLFAGLILIYGEKPWKWLVAALFLLLLSFSRIYLGVHFFTDILAGWCVGVCLLAIYYYLFPLMENMLAKLPIFAVYVLSQVIPLALLLFFYSKSAIESYGTAMGIGAGLYLAYFLNLLGTPAANQQEAVVKSLIGVLGTIACAFLLQWSVPREIGWPLFIGNFLFGIWVGLGMQLACRLTLQLKDNTS